MGYWSYVLMAVGIVGLLLIGRMKRIGWIINIAAQLLWVIYAVATEQYGFLITALVYAVTYYRGLKFLIKTESVEKEEPAPPIDHREYVRPEIRIQREDDCVLIGRVIVPRGVLDTHHVEIDFTEQTADGAPIYEVRGYPR